MTKRDIWFVAALVNIVALYVMGGADAAAPLAAAAIIIGYLEARDG